MPDDSDRVRRSVPSVIPGSEVMNMRVPVIVVTLAVALAMAGQVAAAQAAKPAKSAAAHSAIAGKLESYDASTRMLKIRTGKNEQEFTLAANAVVHQGAKTLMADDLASHQGQSVKVRYTVANSQKTADSITIAGATHRASTAKRESPNK